MGLNDRVSAERIHIGFFGLRNAGKSSVVNAVTGQKLSLVSEVKGTTTDPVQKAMELLPLGPVVIIDTPGIDDEGKLGEMRVMRAKQVLSKTDIAILTVDAARGMQDADRELCDLFSSRKIPYIVVFNKSDLLAEIPAAAENEMIKSLRTELDRTKEAYEALLEAKSCDTREGNVTFSRAMQTLERLKDYLGPTALEEYQTLGGE